MENIANSKVLLFKKKNIAGFKVMVLVDYFGWVTGYFQKIGDYSNWQN